MIAYAFQKYPENFGFKILESLIFKFHFFPQKVKDGF